MSCGRMRRPLMKFGKRLSFPSAPSSWVCRKADEVESSQDRRPKSKILFPLPRDNCPPPPPPPLPPPHHSPPLLCDSRNDKESYFWDYYSEIRNFIVSQIPKYSDSVVTESKQFLQSTTPIEIGQPFDVISLLSYSYSNEENYLFRLKNGDRDRDRDRADVEDLRGKNIMVCCVHLPVYWASAEAEAFRKLPLACSKAFCGHGDGDYEVVVVPRMRLNWATDQDAFDHFLSGLPSSWLAIPFSHPLRRDLVCKSLGLVSAPICLFVDHNHKVFLHLHLNSCIISLIDNKDRTPWWKTHSTLDAILGCKPSDCLHKINNDASVMMSVSDLNTKLVGLYLCKDGSFLRTLSLVHQECQSKGLDFEVILVYLPVCYSNVNPQLFQDVINHMLHKLKIDSWWVLPHNDFRFDRFKKGCTSFSEDELIIVGPHNEYLDPFGKHVISCFGFNAYPFTRERVVEKEYQEIRALTLQNLLGNVSLYHQHHRRVLTLEQLPAAKIVLLYMDYAMSLDQSIYEPLLYWYLHYKRTRDSCDFEVIFVSLDEAFDAFDAKFCFPWFSCTLHSQRKAFLKNHLLTFRCKALTAFGKDGQILSLEAQDLLASYDPDGIESYEGLRNEVIKNVRGIYSVNEVDLYEMRD